MLYEKIDLYDYFSVRKPESGVGRLTAYCRECYGDLEKKLRPAMLVVAGGGYEMVSAREQEPVALRFLHEGYAAFVLDYAVNTAYPTPLIEAAMAMAYLRENAEKYGVDPSQVGVIGFSAGGHLAGMLATLCEDEPVRTLLKGKNVRPDAVLLCYSVLTGGEFTHGGTFGRITGNDPALCKALSLETRVTEKCPPAFLWHTAEDGCVPVENSLLFAAACRKAGVPFELHLFEKGRHGVSVAGAETERCREGAEEVGHLAVWFDLALAWLKKRGFGVAFA